MTTIKKLKKWDGFDFERNKTFEKPLREGTDSSERNLWEILKVS